MKDDESKERRGQYFNMLMNKENQRVETEERDPNQAMTRNISEEETETALKGILATKYIDANFKGKGDIQECKNYRGIKLISHTFKIRERQLWIGG